MRPIWPRSIKMTSWISFILSKDSSTVWCRTPVRLKTDPRTVSFVNHLVVFFALDFCSSFFVLFLISVLVIFIFPLISIIILLSSSSSSSPSSSLWLLVYLFLFSCNEPYAPVEKMARKRKHHYYGIIVLLPLLHHLLPLLLQLWCNPLCLTGLKAPTD